MKSTFLPDYDTLFYFAGTKSIHIPAATVAPESRIANLASWEFDILNNRYILNDRFYTMIGTSAIKEGGYTMSSEDYFNRFIHPMMWSLF